MGGGAVGLGEEQEQAKAAGVEEEGETKDVRTERTGVRGGDSKWRRRG